MRERIWAGDIPVVRFPGGRKQFIDTEDLEDFIQRNKMTIRKKSWSDGMGGIPDGRGGRMGLLENGSEISEHF